MPEQLERWLSGEMGFKELKVAPNEYLHPLASLKNRSTALSNTHRRNRVAAVLDREIRVLPICAPPKLQLVTLTFLCQPAPPQASDNDNPTPRIPSN